MSARAKNPAVCHIDALNEDVLFHIVAVLLGLAPRNYVTRRDMLSAKQAALSVSAFLCTQSRINACAKKFFPHIRQELTLRMQGQIGVPAGSAQNALTPFLGQSQKESACKRQFRMLRVAESAMALHCSGKCCHASRRAFARDARQKDSLQSASILPVAPQCNILAISQCGCFAFVSVRLQCTENRSARKQAIVAYQLKKAPRVHNKQECSFVEAARIDVPCANRSAPTSMKIAHSGRSVAFVQVCNTTSLHEAPFTNCQSVLSTWMPFQETGGFAEPVVMTPLHDHLPNAQDFWFGSCDVLHVAWSCEYVARSGSVVRKHGAAFVQPSSHFFATYEVSSSGTIWLEELSHFSSRIFTCSATRRGDEILTIVQDQQSSLLNQNQFKDGKVQFIRLSENKNHMLPLTCKRRNIASASRSSTLIKKYAAVVCATISPLGDSGVAVEHCTTNVYATLLSRVSNNSMTARACVDLTFDFFGGTISTSVTFQDLECFWHRLAYAACYSPCGRFVIVSDTSTQLGKACRGNCAVALDCSEWLSCRDTVRRVNCFPSDCMQAPRSFAWTTQGVAIELSAISHFQGPTSRGGAVLVRLPFDKQL